MYVRRMPTLNVACYVVALVLTGATGCSSAQQRDDGVTIIDNSRQAAVAQIGTVGVNGYDSKANYRLVMRPTITDGELFVPSTDGQAITELKKTLPESYLKNLRTVNTKDQNGKAVSVCKSENNELDYLVRQWLVVYWNLDNQNSDLGRLYAARGGYYADSIAEEVMTNLCKRQAL